jgi:outer membrane protein assembly factor BamB
MLGLLAVSCGGRSASPRGWAEPVESGKTVMVSSSRGKISGVDTDTNLLKWQFPGSWTMPKDISDDLKGVYGAPVVASDGNTTFIADYNGIIYAFNQTDGTLSGNKKLAGALKLKDPVIGGIAISKSAGVLFVTTGDRVVKVKYAAGSPPTLTLDPGWAVQTGDDIWGVPVISGDRVLFSSLDGKLYSVNQNDAADRWEYDPNGSGLVSTPAIIGSTVYVGGFDSKLHAVDLATGEAKWTFQASYWVWSTPIASGNDVIFGDFNGRIYSVSQSDGSESWEIDLGRGPIVGAPVVAQGTLVAGTQDGWLVGIDPSSRETTWETKLPTSFTADLVTVANGSAVLIAPRGCVTPEGATEKVYYYSVDPTNGELKTAQNVC